MVNALKDDMVDRDVENRGHASARGVLGYFSPIKLDLLPDYPDSAF